MNGVAYLLAHLALIFSITKGQILETYDEEARCVRRCYRRYTGSLQTSVTGKSCRHWRVGDFSPMFDDVDIAEMGNKCRNPDFQALPYCYVSETEWEYCFRSNCPDEPFDNNCGVPGFYRLNNRCYKTLAERTYNRSSAIDACQQLTNRTEINLVRIHSEDELVFVNSLSCLPLYVGAKRRKNVWSWNDQTNWGISNEANEFPWCNGFPVDDPVKNCLVMQPHRCFENVNCRNSEEPYQSACQMGTELAKFSEKPLADSLTWKSSLADCNNEVGFRLCFSSEICVSSNDTRRTFLTRTLPLLTNSWVPVADEYNEWVYVGPNSERYCELHTDAIGPLETLPQTMQICCRKENENDEVRLPNSELVTVYVRSAIVDDNVLYKYSLYKENTLEEIRSDHLSWYYTQRFQTDITSFNLWSHYKENIAENVIYFCKKSDTAGLRTILYRMSTTGCEAPLTLDFYLYGSMVRNSEASRALYIMSSSNSVQQPHTRVSQNSSICCGYNGTEGPFKFYASSIEANFTTSNRSACDRLLRIQDKRGVISSPGFPNSIGSNTICRWRVSAPTGSVIRINFTEMFLQSSGSGHDYFVAADTWQKFREIRGVQFNHWQTCPFESVQVKPTKVRAARIGLSGYGVFCGIIRPQSFMTIDNVVVIELINNNSTQRFSRFILRYEVLPPPLNLEYVNLSPNNDRIETWLDLRTRCVQKGKEFCTSANICKYGRPFYKVEDGSHFVPVLDELNEWIQIGRADSQTCQLHNPLLGPPQWGTNESFCESNPRPLSCPDKISLYCCDVDRSHRKTPLKFVPVTVLTASYNGIVFSRYIRDGIDNLTATELIMWRQQKHSSEDVSSFSLFNRHVENYTKAIYFCSRRLRPSFGPFSVIYTMQEVPCYSGWRLQYYLYGSDEHQYLLIDDNAPVLLTKRFYVGMSFLRPHHSRITFNSYARRYDYSTSFIVYGYSSEIPPIPTTTMETLSTTTPAPPRVISTCQISPALVTSVPITITSPNYPNDYANSMRCQWLVTMDGRNRTRDTRLILTITDIYLEDTFNCVNDRLQISSANYDPRTGNVTNITRLDRRCGRNIGEALITDKSILIDFTTDFSLTRKGFSLYVDTITDSCGGIVAANGEDFASPGYPIRYLPGLNCTWDIRAPNAGYNIEIQFVKLHLLDSEDCIDDRLIISYPNITENLVYCGRLEPPRLPLPSHSVSLQLVTRHRNISAPTEQGFSAYVYFNPRNESGRGRCGVADVAPWPTGGAASARVIGGLEAVVGSWPWVAMLDGASCGGTLINDRWIVTAAHCVVPRNTPNQNFSNYVADVSHITVVLGRHVEGIPSPINEQSSAIERVFVYPGYVRRRPPGALESFGRSQVPTNDIALLRLRTPVRTTSHVKPICLPRRDAIVGKTCVIAGWGAIGIRLSNSDRRDVLRYARLPILRNSLCNTWPALAGGVGDNNICAGFAAGGVDACKGDSGGPLMCKDDNSDSYHLHGIVSWGKQCGKPRQPGIYTRVWPFYDWITGHVFSEL